jgi:DNA-directed RNA polymerase subunit RPC12/RpoP
LLGGLALGVWAAIKNQKNKYGELNPQVVCPHCQTKGMVKTKLVKSKKGISGGKATAAVLTGGASVLATGLSRKEKETQAHCENCNNTWIF